MSPRRWPLVAIVLLCAFGVFVGGLLTWHHDTQLYGTDADKGELIGCVESAQVNCDIVNTSQWSELGGVPIGTLAIGAYATVAGLAITGLRGRRGALLPLWAAGFVAVLCSAFLFYQSKVELGYVCAWCLRLYATNLGLLVMAVAAGKPDTTVDARVLQVGGATLAASLVIAAGGERAWRTTLLGSEGGASLEARVAEQHGDPEGPAPALSFMVQTEDGKDATFQLDPDDAWKGDPDAKVAVVEFADLQCGYCKRMSSEIGRLYQAYGDRVLFVFKHFPMNPTCNPGVKNNKHRDACRAAVASVCAQEQGHFWDFHDLAFKNQHQLGDDYLRTYVEKAGADVAKFDPCVNDPSKLEIVRHDAEVGASLDIHGTPRIFVNGKLYRSGTSAEAMARALDAAIGIAAADSKAGSLHEDADVVAAIPADVPSMRNIAYDGLSFSIDTFEAAIADGQATSAKHQVPAMRVSWYEAEAACEASGKRLCTEEEWVSACQGARAVDDNGNGELADDMIEGTAWPYADWHEDRRCWDDHEGDAKSGEPWRPVYTGEMPGCVSKDGVYDLTGNVEEWVGDSPERAVLLGGAFDTSEDHARCYRRNDTFGAGYRTIRAGFRCCSS